MNKLNSGFLRFIFAVVFVWLIHYVYYGEHSPEVESSTPRVRFLDIPTEHKYEPDALAEIYIEGEIDADLINEFNEIIKRHSLKHARVLFSSNGGNIDNAIELGWHIRNLGFSTDVGSYSGTWDDSYAAGCFSACTMAYLGGKYRFFHPKSEFGVHQYKSEHAMGLYTFSDIEVYAQSFSGYMLDYVTEMGVDPEFYEITVAQTNDDIEYIGYEDLIRLQIINNGAQPPKWEMTLENIKPILKGHQERLGQNGEFTVTCNNGPVFKIINRQKKYTSNNIPSQSFELIIDRQTNDVTKQIDTKNLSVSNGELIIEFRPSQYQVIEIIGSEIFGMKFKNSSQTWFRQTISIDKDRKLLSNIVNFCYHEQ